MIPQVGYHQPGPKIGPYDLVKQRDGIKPLLDYLVGCPILDGVFLEDVVLTSGANNVAHTLGRKWRGWLLCNIDGTETLYATRGDNDDIFLPLTVSAAATVSLWIF